MSTEDPESSTLPAWIKQSIDEDKVDKVPPKIEQTSINILQKPVGYVHEKYKPVFDEWQETHMVLRQLHARVHGPHKKLLEVDHDHVHFRVSNIREGSASTGQLMEELQAVIKARRQCQDESKEALDKIDGRWRSAEEQ